MEILHRIETYIESAKIPPATFGRQAVGDPRIVWDLRAGRQPRRKMQAKIISYLDEVNSSQ